MRVLHAIYTERTDEDLLRVEMPDGSLLIVHIPKTSGGVRVPESVWAEQETSR